MPPAPQPIRGFDIIARWRDLAERHVANLIEMYETGRWTRYYEEAEFRELMRESVAAVEAWRRLGSLHRQLDPRRSDQDGAERAASAPCARTEELPPRAAQSLQNFSAALKRGEGGG